uniref:Uncharacterized protein n=1 Tax=Tanacetum cinerariifolium TaxID=118510 RepID=A0A699HEX4_TANCI|nr:hypothetical protein [Tanacetum cinerariifolium]
MKWIESFVSMDTELVKGSEKAEEGSSKRAAGKLEQKDAKRQRIKEENESAKLKRFLEIIPDNDDDVIIEATPISSKSLTIVDYKIYKEGMKSFFKIIKADGNSQNYLTFGKMFKNFNRENLENMVYYLLVEKMYQFTRNILHQMWNDVRLQVDYEVEISYDLLRLIRRQISEGYVPE